MIAEVGETIGTATNNVAEYRGLIAGLELAAEHAPEAEIEVRMDSKLVVEQMAGNWKIKHPSMKPLAIEANRLAPDRHDVHLGPAGRERARRPARERGPRRPPRRERVDLGGRGASVSERRRNHAEDEAQARLGPTPRQAHHAGPGPPRRHRRHQGQALLRRPGQQQPAAERRGPRAGPGHGGVAGPAVGHLRRAGQLAGAAYARDRRDPRRVLRPRGRGGARHRRDGVRHLGRDELHRGAREVARRARLLARRPRVGARTAASRSGPWRSGCSRAATGWWRRTPGRRWSWSAT